MNDLMSPLPRFDLAPAQQRALQRSMGRMSTALAAYRQAIDHSGEIHDYAAFKAFQSLSAAAALRNAALMQGFLTPEIDRQLVKLSEDYVRGLRATRNAADARLLQLAADVAAGRIDGDGLINRLLGK